MTEVTTLSIPQAVITEAKLLGINCSKTAREAIQDAISKKKHGESNPDTIQKQ